MGHHWLAFLLTLFIAPPKCNPKLSYSLCVHLQSQVRTAKYVEKIVVESNFVLS